MARTRSIKPGFFDNFDLAQLDPLARLLFIGLWCYCDRSGRIKDQPERIKAQVLPYDRCNIQKLLNSLSDGRDSWLIRYEQDGVEYIQVRNWQKHQNPHVKEPNSTIPAPCLSGSCLVQNRNENSSNPSLTGPITGNGNGSPGLDDLCSAFIGAYPEKGRKKSGLVERWYAYNLGLCVDPGKLHAEIMAGLERAKRSEEWGKLDGKYLCGMLPFLEGKRWLEAWPESDNGRETPLTKLEDLD